MTPAERTAHDRAVLASPSWWRRQAESLRETSASLRAMGSDASHVDAMARNAARQACDHCDRIRPDVTDRSDPVWSPGEAWLCSPCADAACEREQERVATP